MKGGFFEFAVDGETATRCINLVQRAADRLARGEPVCLGERQKRGATSIAPGEKKNGKRPNPKSLRDAAKARKMRVDGLKYREIAEELGVTKGRVNYLLQIKGAAV